jgi:hypothetical protein
MKRTALLPLAIIALVACSDAATAPKTLDPGRPALDVSPGSYAATINGSFAPSGAHLQRGSIGCTVNADRSIDCSSFELAGVGNTNVLVILLALYTATIDCNNPSLSNKNNPIESHTSEFTAGSIITVASTKNGRLGIPTRHASPFGAQQVCPNDNWVPEIRDGTVTLLGFRYAIVFAGFSDDNDEDYILIAQGDDPR